MKKEGLDAKEEEKPDGNHGRFRGQIHFPVLSQPLNVSTFLIILAIAIVVAALVWWLR